jgi:hypothetical protein
MTPAADSIPAILESEATGEIREVYQDIKAVTGVDVVNLIWRRLAVTSGALPAVWAMVRPIYVSGRVVAEAQAFRRHLRPPQLPLIPKAALAAAGVDKLGQITIRAILDSYDRTNAMNLIGLSAVLARLDAADGVAGSPPTPMQEPPLPALPPLPSLTALDPPIRQLVDMLNAICEEDGRVIASMYRHLAYWPGYLALSWTLLTPIASDGSMQAVINEARQQSATRARAIAAELDPLDGTLDQAAIDDIREVLTLFTQHPISKMVAICRALASATPAP